MTSVSVMKATRREKRRTHDGEEHTALIPSRLDGAAEYRGQGVERRMLELVQTFHLHIFSIETMSSFLVPAIEDRTYRVADCKQAASAGRDEKQGMLISVDCRCHCRGIRWLTEALVMRWVGLNPV
jgi:hypothetical protein